MDANNNKGNADNGFWIGGGAGLMQPECKKVFSVLGCLFSIIGLLTIFGMHQMLH